MYRSTTFETQETIAPSGKLTATDRADLSRFERTIARGIQEWIAVSKALLEIKRRHLYREHHLSWADYCEKRWKFKRAHAYRLVEAAGVVEDLAGEPLDKIVNEVSPNGRHSEADSSGSSKEKAAMRPMPHSERVTRPLKPLSAEERRAVWDRAVKSSSDNRPTEREVEKAKRGYFAEMVATATAEIEEEEEELIQEAKGLEIEAVEIRRAKRWINNIEKAIRAGSRVSWLKEKNQQLMCMLAEVREEL